MAVVTYKVSLDATGQVASLDPSQDSIEFVQGDFLIFQPVDPGTNILVQFTGGPQVCCGIIAPGRKVKLDLPTVSNDGDVIISFVDAGGNDGGSSNFPP